MSDDHPFHTDLTALGFHVVQEDRRAIQYSWRATRFLTYWVHWNPDADSALFTWELAIGDLMHERGMQIGANESLNTFLYPQYDAKGPADIGFVARELDRAEAVLRSIDLTADAGTA